LFHPECGDKRRQVHALIQPVDAGKLRIADAKRYKSAAMIAHAAEIAGIGYAVHRVYVLNVPFRSVNLAKPEAAGYNRTIRIGGFF